MGGAILSQLFIIFTAIALIIVLIFYFKKSIYQKTILKKKLIDLKINHLEKFDKKRSEFLQIAAHQLKSPLGITRFILTGFYNDKTLSPMKKKKAEQALFQIESAIDFLQDTTQILNLEDKSGNTKKEDIEIEILIKEILTEFETQIREKNIHISKYVGGIIPIFKSDRMYLKIAFTNVIDNAIKYSKEGARVIINITYVNNELIVSVEDNGIGITKADQERLFEKFFRGENAKIKVPKGTGLGLYLVKTSLDKIGGNINFKSVFEKGSIFTIKIPIPTR